MSGRCAIHRMLIAIGMENQIHAHAPHTRTSASTDPTVAIAPLLYSHALRLRGSRLEGPSPTRVAAAPGPAPAGAVPYTDSPSTATVDINLDMCRTDGHVSVYIERRGMATGASDVVEPCPDEACLCMYHDRRFRCRRSALAHSIAFDTRRFRPSFDILFACEAIMHDQCRILSRPL